MYCIRHNNGTYYGHGGLWITKDRWEDIKFYDNFLTASQLLHKIESSECDVVNSLTLVKDMGDELREIKIKLFDSNIEHLKKTGQIVRLEKKTRR
jgi:hypothetical protein